MRQRIAALLVLMLVNLPASAGFEYTFEGSVTEDFTGMFAPGTPISGRLFWSPENAVLLGGPNYSYVFSYEYNIGSFSFTSPASLDAFVSNVSGQLYDATPTGPVSDIDIDDLAFSPTFAFTSLDMDLSGLWHTDGVVFLDGPGPNLNLAEYHGLVTMTKVPEPGTLVLFASALVLAAVFRRRRATLRL
jgi:hypothetical protein